MTNKERLRYQGCNQSLELEGQTIQWPIEKGEKRQTMGSNGKYYTQN